MITLAHGFRTAIARELERGDFAPRLVRAAWGEMGRSVMARSLVRRGATSRARLIAVGGSTLGGSGKTPVTRALALALRERGEDVAIAAHGYRARVEEPRWVLENDDVRIVGDDALYLARALPPRCVAIGRSRAEAIGYAAERSSIVIVDGALALQPGLADVRILVLDARDPWSSGAVRPFGDLLATPRALIEAASDVVWVGEPHRPLDVSDTAAVQHYATCETVLTREETRVLPQELSSLRVGVFTAIARPARFARALHGIGVEAAVLLRFSDHGPVDRSALVKATKKHAIDVWITTEKCNLHAPLASTLAIVTAEQTVRLPASLLARVPVALGESLAHHGRP